MQPKRKKPLYRKVNTRARGVRHDFGGDFKHHRNGKCRQPVKMARGKQRGLDYTPLFRFLVSKIGSNWNEVYSEAVSRLDNPEPIYQLVAMDLDDGQAAVRIGESSYFSGLYVDNDGILQLVDPSLDEHSMPPSCECCTHTFNGIRFTQSYEKTQ